jgi:hypothetical protein
MTLRLAATATISIIVAIVALVAVKQVSRSHARSPTEASASDQASKDAGRETVYAFLTTTELDVAQGDQVIHRTSAPFAEPGQSPDDIVGFTDDGRYTYAVTVSASSPATLVVFDTKTWQRRDIVCSCQHAVSTGGDGLAWIDGQGRLTETDLARGTVRVLSVRTSTGEVARDGRALAGAHDIILFEGFFADSVGKSVQRHALVDLSGTVTAFVEDEGWGGWPIGSSSAATSYGGPRIAYWTAKRCLVPDTVSILDPKTGTRTTTDASATHAGPRPTDPQLHVHDLWWRPDGKLYAAMSLVDSCESPKHRFLTAPTLWRLDGTTWTPIRGGSARVARTLSAHAIAVARESPTDFPSQQDVPGRLYFETRDLSVKIADNVFSLATPPWSA